MVNSETVMEKDGTVMGVRGTVMATTNYNGKTQNYPGKHQNYKHKLLQQTSAFWFCRPMLREYNGVSEVM
ncbi:hypothetical protein [Sporosarcina beigongshangi]|uniref:hypothetical protein n=1 Tax=Sporosarcina beigongshangi TaxID=2782538 RepID=UPI00193A2C74|nr:hypothetical protein [Sporosarcina beigongshangi]